MDEAEGRRREAGIGVWLDGYAKGGARMCNNTTPSAPANSAAARHSDRSTGSNATTAYYASPSLCLSVFPSFHPSIRPSVLLFVSFPSFLALSQLTLLSFHLLSPTLSFTCACTWWCVTSSLPSCTRTSEDSWRIV